MDETIGENMFHHQMVDDLDETTSLPLNDGSLALLNSIVVDGGDRFSVSATEFDTREELLWMGNSGGHLTSYYGAGLEKYTSFQVHPRNDVRKILTIDAGVLALTKSNLKCNSRQGMGIFNYTSPHMVDMQSMHLYTPKSVSTPTSVLLGGYQPRLILLDLYELKEIRKAELKEQNCLVIRSTDKFVFTGDTNGKIAMRNWESLEAIQLLEAHNGPISDFDICGTKLVTCGFSTRSTGTLNCDRFLMVYDLRMLRAVAPITVNFDPFFLRFVPTYSDNRLLVASQAGNFQILDINAAATSSFFCHADTQGTALLSMDVSPTKQCVAFGDGAGVLHVFSDRAAPIFNECSRATEFADQPTPIPPIPFSDQTTPLSVVPMPLHLHCGHLLSDWPSHLMKRIHRTPQPIDQEILRNMKMVNFIGHAPRPSNMKHGNMVPYDLKRDKAMDVTVSRSRSPLVTAGSGAGRASSAQRQQAGGSGSDESSPVPMNYRKVVLKYGRDEPDYKSYNQTCFAALEPGSSNSYINPLLQVLFHMKPLRHAVWSHICRVEFCLTCEMSFLFHMLQSAGARQTCSASNFLRAFRTMPEASALSLVLAEREQGNETSLNKSIDLPMLIQRVNLFLLRQSHSELVSKETKKPELELDSKEDESKKEAESSDSPTEKEGDNPSEEDGSGKEESIIETLFSSSIYYITRCKCGNEMARDDKSMVLTLAQAAGANGAGTDPKACFATSLEKSFSLEQTTQSWCEECAKFQMSLQSRRTKSLPEVLVVNCPVENVEKKNAAGQKATQPSMPPGASEKPCRFGINCIRANCFYFHPERSLSPAPPLTPKNGASSTSLESSTDPKREIPMGLRLRLDSKGIVTVNLDLEEKSQEEDNDGNDDVIYDLYAMVELIRQSNEQHLVACIRIGDEWTLFNDFCVSKATTEEATTFDTTWKSPCLLYYTKRDYGHRYTNEASCLIDERVLLSADESVASLKRLSSLTFVPLDPDELPKTGDHVGLDAEFVTLNEEESELHSDGTKLTIKPSHKSVARVTVLRGSGPREGVPFIDDYISTQDEVVDYLTKFSGIKPDDLNPSLTSKHLTTLKSSYVKLRYLIDNGVIFIGHGLANDFRVLNLAVPPEQVIDTVQLFRLPNRRMISLRFLAWHFLGTRIQSVTHDSAEDARTAMKLYKKYQELLEDPNAAGNFKRIMNEVYEKGRNLQWQVPNE